LSGPVAKACSEGDGWYAARKTPGAEAAGGWGADVRGRVVCRERWSVAGAPGPEARRGGWVADVLRSGGIPPAGTREWRSAAGAARVR